MQELPTETVVPAKIMLRVILNPLKSMAEELPAKEQVGVSDRGVVHSNRLFNFRVIMEKHLPYKRDIFHKLIDFKKAFGRVLHDGL